ncbi:hypothetical protein ACFYRL_06000 [Streptomyces goshikiensis]|uniref:hypothetical protein n=1 Tax=Streptomyces goshikiensis TaxID=1942 RepID=UPI00367F932B
MSRTAAPRRVRTAVLASAGVLAVGAIYGLAQHADASDAPLSAAAAGSASGADGTPAPGASTDAPAEQGGSEQPSASTASPSGAAPSRSAAAGKGKAKSADMSGKAVRSTGVVVEVLEADRVAPGELPDSAQQKWKELAPARTQPLTQDFQLNECASVPGATNWRQQAFVSSHKTPAVQNSLSFKDEAAAKAAYEKVLDGMNSCTATSQALQKQYGLKPDAAVQQTATSDNGRAWSRRWDGVQGASASGVQTNHVYAVQRGAVLTLLTFDEWDAAAPASYDSRADASVLAMLAG